jgi:hypothetical protein
MPLIQELPLDPKPPWGILTNLKLQELANYFIHWAWHTLSSLSPHILINPLTLNQLNIIIIRWPIPRVGYGYYNCLEALILG